MEHTTILLILAASFGLFMAWGIGANDVANAMATSVGSRALTIKQAVIIAPPTAAITSPTLRVLNICLLCQKNLSKTE